MKNDELLELNELNESKNTEGKSSLLDEFLMLQPKEIQRQVRATAERWNIDKDDPFFLILLQCRITQILYEETPSNIAKAFEIGNEEIIAQLERYAYELREIQTKSLAKYEQEQNKLNNLRLKKAVARVLEDNNLHSGKKGGFSPRVLGSLVTATAVFFCSIISFWGGTQLNNSAIVTDWKQKLEAQDRVLLDWAKSPEGNLAKNIVDWNEDLANKSCSRKVKDLGISFQIGSAKAVSGFCVVFIEPPSRRNFR